MIERGHRPLQTTTYGGFESVLFHQSRHLARNAKAIDEATRILPVGVNNLLLPDYVSLDTVTPVLPPPRRVYPHMIIDEFVVR